jgi:hypothetical protein
MKVLLEVLTSLMKIYAQTLIYHFKKNTAVTHLRVLLPDPSMLSTQDLGVKIPIILSGVGAGIGLSGNLDMLFLGEDDVFYN